MGVSKRRLSIEPEGGPLFIGLLTVAMSVVVSIGALGWPIAEDADLPHQDVVRDVIRERGAAADAISSSPAASDHLRTPGAIVLVLPVLLFPQDHLTWTAAGLAALGAGALVLGSHRLAGRRGVILAIGVPTSVAFTQGVLHGSMFVLIAAALTWGWVLLESERRAMSGILLGVAGAARLWPLLLVVPMLLRRSWRPLAWTGITVVALTAVGLALPGVSWESTLESFDASSERWMSATHNGSLAGWLDPLGGWAGPVGFAVVISVWAIGLLRVKTSDGRMAWSIPAAILASPLAWMPYLLSLAPVVAVYGNRRSTRTTLIAVYALLLFGYVWIPRSVVTTAAVVTVLAVVAVEGDEPFSTRSRSELPPRSSGSVRLRQAE